MGIVREILRKNGKLVWAVLLVLFERGLDLLGFTNIFIGTFCLVIAGVLAVAWAYSHNFFIEQYSPVFKWIIFGIVSILFVVLFAWFIYYQYFKYPFEIDKDIETIRKAGIDPIVKYGFQMGGLEIENKDYVYTDKIIAVLNLSDITAYASDYKVRLGCSVDDPTKDFADEDKLWSNPFFITDIVNIEIKLPNKFIAEYCKHGKGSVALCVAGLSDEETGEFRSFGGVKGMSLFGGDCTEIDAQMRK